MGLNFSLNVNGDKRELIERLTTIIDDISDMDDEEFVDEGNLYLTSGAVIEITA